MNALCFEDESQLLYFRIENYIDELGILEKAKEESDLAVNKNRLNIVTLGRFCYEKGFDRIITAINRLKEDNIKIEKLKVYILGYGKEQAKLNKKIEEYDLKDSIEVITMSDLDNNPYAFMKNCNLYIMPSRSESFGMVRIEALVLGLPVITTNVANTDKMVSKDLGLVVDNTDEGVYLGLKEVLTNETLVAKLIENAKYYTYEGENKRIINKIKEVLEVDCE